MSASITKEALVTKVRGRKFRETQMKTLKRMKSYSLLSAKNTSREEVFKKKLENAIDNRHENKNLCTLLLPNDAYFSRICSLWINLMVKAQ